MKEFQEIPGSSVYNNVENLLIKEVKQLWKSRRDIRTDKLDVQHERHTVVFTRIIKTLPFLKPKEVVAITISPPYNFTDVHILDEKSKEFGIRLREQLGLFWEFGEEYQTSYVDEKQSEDEYILGLFTESLAENLGSGNDPKTDEDWLDYYREKFARDEKAFAESIN